MFHDFEVERLGVRNPELCQSVREFAIAALDILAERSGNLRDSGSFGSAPLSLMFIPEIRELPSYLRCMAQMRDDAVVASHFDALVGTPSVRSRFPGPDRLMLRLPEMATSGESLVFDDLLFQHRYQEFEDSFYEPFVRYEVLAPLSGGAEFAAPFSFGSGPEICRLDSGLKVSTKPLSNRALDLETVWSIRTQYCVEKVIESDKKPGSRETESVDDIRQSANNEVDRVLACLRLLGITNVCALYVIHRSLSWVVPGDYPFASRYVPHRQFQRELEPEFADSARALWGKLHSRAVESHSSLRLAASRLSAVSERHRWEDKVVDILIAAEAGFMAITLKR